jgi:hypothetical protein
MLALVVVVLVSCGGDPPDKELQQAQGAIEAARAAGADRYARDEFVAAEDSLKNARDAVADRDYRLALTRALDSRDRAETAAREAAENLASARTSATSVLAAVDATLVDLRAKVRAIESGPRGHGAAEAREVIAAAETNVQKARAAVQAGDYRGAADLLTNTLSVLRETTAAVAPAPAPPTHRKR